MTKDLTVGKPRKLILSFTLPLLAGNIFQQLYAFVDTLIVGRFLGVEALAAVGCTGSLMFLMIGFITGLTTGFTIYTGQRFGAKDEEGVRRSVAACGILSAISSVVLTAGGVLLCGSFLAWMQTPAEILADARAFITIVYGGIGAGLFFLLQTNLLRALGDSRTPTVLLAIGLSLNIILEPIFILVLGLGIPGAAMATVAAQLLGNVITFLYILKKVPALRTTRHHWQVDRNLLWQHLRMGLPMGFQASIIAIGAIILQVALNQLGPLAVAAYAAAQKVDAIAVMPMMSFGMTMAAYTAQNYGARAFNRIHEGVRQGILLSGSFSILAGAFNIMCGPWIMELFVGPEAPQVVSYGHIYLGVNGVCYFILALLFIYRFTLQGLGKTAVPTVAGIMELIMRTAAAVFLVDIFGYLGACLANPLAWLGSCIPLFIAYCWERRYLRGRTAN